MGQAQRSGRAVLIVEDDADSLRAIVLLKIAVPTEQIEEEAL
jgi:hypothetical protein